MVEVNDEHLLLRVAAKHPEPFGEVVLAVLEGPDEKRRALRAVSRPAVVRVLHTLRSAGQRALIASEIGRLAGLDRKSVRSGLAHCVALGLVSRTVCYRLQRSRFRTVRRRMVGFIIRRESAFWQTLVGPLVASVRTAESLAEQAERRVRWSVPAGWDVVPEVRCAVVGGVMGPRVVLELGLSGCGEQARTGRWARKVKREMRNFWGVRRVRVIDVVAR